MIGYIILKPGQLGFEVWVIIPFEFLLRKLFLVL